MRVPSRRGVLEVIADDTYDFDSGWTVMEWKELGALTLWKKLDVRRLRHVLKHFPQRVEAPTLQMGELCSVRLNYPSTILIEIIQKWHGEVVYVFVEGPSGKEQISRGGGLSLCDSARGAPLASRIPSVLKPRDCNQ